MISIVVPIHNLETELSYCVESLLSQTYPDFELLLIDDGSYDNSYDVYMQHLLMDARVQVLLQQNSGVSAARNAGIELARGEYIAFVDGDDIVAPNYLERLLGLIEGNKLALCGYSKIDSYERTFRASNHKVSSQTAAECAGRMLQGRFPISAWCCLFRRSTVDGLRFQVGIKSNEDKLFLYEYLLACADGTVAITDEPLYGYVTRAGSVTQSAWDGSTDVIQVADAMLELTRQEHPEWIDVAQRAVIVARLEVIKNGLQSSCNEEQRDMLRRVRTDVLREGLPKGGSAQMRIEYAALRLGFKPYELLTKAYYVAMSPARRERRNQHHIKQGA